MSIKIKNSKAIYPVYREELNLNYIPVHNDIQFMSLKLDLVNECKYKPRATFYDITENSVYVIADIEIYSDNCKPQIIIKADIEEPKNIVVDINYGDRQFEHREEIKTLFIPKMPIFKDNLILHRNGTIYSISVRELIFQDDNKNPEIIVGGISIHTDIKSCFTSYIGANAVWPMRS